MCRERWRTRDLLLEYDTNIMPPHPRAAGLNTIYPWENIDLNILSHEIYQLALNHGFSGDEESFWNRFNNTAIITGTISTFPVPGEENILYLDLVTDILYYFKSTTTAITPAEAALHGIEIVETNGATTYLYIPVRAMFMEDTILNCGSAAEYID